MKENILNLPQHLRRLRKVHSEQVALAMVGEYSLTHLIQIDRLRDPEQLLAACAFHDCM